jgi:hypothetical protein
MTPINLVIPESFAAQKAELNPHSQGLPLRNRNSPRRVTPFQFLHG